MKEEVAMSWNGGFARHVGRSSRWIIVCAVFLMGWTMSFEPCSAQPPSGEIQAEIMANAAFGSGDYAVPVQDQPEGEQSVKADVGASLKRDTLDNLLLVDNITYDGTTTPGGVYASRTGGLIDNPSEAGGWPTLSTTTPPEDKDADGIPDEDEPEPVLVGGLDWQNDPRNAQLDDDGDGITNLEDHLSEFVNQDTE